MTTTQPFTNPSLSVDPFEDHMEMATSPYRAQHDDDIDFELDDDREHSIEDNIMLDDAADDTTYTGTQDDMMFDEDESGLLEPDQEYGMNPDEAWDMNFRDVDQPLDDASVHHSPVEDPVSQTKSDESMPVQEPNPTISQQDAYNDEYHQEEENTNTAPSTANVILNDPNTNIDSSHGTRDVHELDANEQQDASLEPSSTAVVDFADEANVEQLPGNEDDNEQISHDDTTSDEQDKELVEKASAEQNVTETIEALAGELDQSRPEQDRAEQPEQLYQSPQREDSPETLHPVTIRFNGQDCWLFPPLDTIDTRHIFLQDIGLASQPFDKLLAAIRPSLIENQEMADHDEIVLDIPTLGLHISEDSKHAPAVTLSRVIDMYMMLSQNEGLTVFEPLFCELSTRVCLADQFAYLNEAAFGRRMTYSDFAAEQAGTPEETSHVDDTAGVEEAEAEVVAHHVGPDDLNEEYEEDEEVTVLAAGIDQPEPEAEAEGEQEEDDTPEIQVDDVQNDEFGTTDESEAHVVADDTTHPPEHTQEHSEDHVVPVRDSASDLPDENLQSAVVDKKASVSQIESVSTETLKDAVNVDEVEETHIDVDIDEEDLFADDNDDAEAEENFDAQSAPEAPEPPVTSNKDAEAVVPELDEDDLDFDNWSDDETQGPTDGDKTLMTPSKGINGKRKLIDDDDDFLEIDVSTPEPKRSRAS